MYNRSIEIFSNNPCVKQISFKRLSDSSAEFQENHSSSSEELFRYNVIFDDEDLDITSTILPMPISGPMEYFIVTKKENNGN